MSHWYKILRFACYNKDVYKSIDNGIVANFLIKKDVIANNCNDAGTFTIVVCVQYATEAPEKRPIWYP